MKIALLFVLVATFLALAYGAPAAPEAEKEVEAVGVEEDVAARNKRQFYALGYGYSPYAYAASPYAYSPYTYASAYAYSPYSYSPYNHGYIYG